MVENGAKENCCFPNGGGGRRADGEGLYDPKIRSWMFPSLNTFRMGWTKTKVFLFVTLFLVQFLFKKVSVNQIEDCLISSISKFNQWMTFIFMVLQEKKEFRFPYWIDVVRILPRYAQICGKSPDKPLDFLTVVSL